MGPTCEVTFSRVNDELLDRIDRHLRDVADEVAPTRKGRDWNVWIAARPVHVRVSDESTALILAAGCNAPEDWSVLEQLGVSLAEALGGQSSKPVK